MTSAVEMRIRRAVADLADREGLPITYRQVAQIAAVAAKASGAPRPVDPPANGQWARPAQGRAQVSRKPVGLTPAQVGLLGLMASGLDEEGVAAALGVRVKVARARVGRLLVSLGGVSWEGAVAVGVARGLLPGAAVSAGTGAES